MCNLAGSPIGPCRLHGTVCTVHRNVSVDCYLDQDATLFVKKSTASMPSREIMLLILTNGSYGSVGQSGIKLLYFFNLGLIHL